MGRHDGFGTSPAFRPKCGTWPSGTTVSLLPGSRPMEGRRPVPNAAAFHANTLVVWDQKFKVASNVHAMRYSQPPKCCCSKALLVFAGSPHQSSAATNLQTQHGSCLQSPSPNQTQLHSTSPNIKTDKTCSNH